MSEKPAYKLLVALAPLTLLLLLITLCISSTRELHWLNARLLLNINPGETIVAGQPIGCVEYNVPSVQLREARIDELATHAATSIDAYLIVSMHRFYLGVIPDDRTCNGDHLIEWTAMTAASEMFVAASTTDVPQDLSEPALHVIHRAQHLHPSNGALWLAEALVHFTNGADDAGLAALQCAGDRPRWHSGKQRAFVRVSTLLEQRGLPSIDAIRKSEYSSFPWLHTRELRDHVEQLMRDSVRTGQDTAFASLLAVWGRLNQCKWENSEYPKAGIGIPRERELYIAMAEAIEANPPDYNKHPFPEDAERRLAFKFVHQKLGCDQAYELLELYRVNRELVHACREFNGRPLAPHHFSWYSARSCGIAGMLSLVLFLALMVTRLPFPLATRGRFIHVAVWRSGVFWFTAVLALAVGGFLIHRVCVLTTHVPRWWALQEKPILTETQTITILLILLMILVFALRTVVTPQGRRAVNAACIIPLLAYVLLTCVGAHFRSEWVTAQHWEYAYDPSTSIYSQ